MFGFDLQAIAFDVDDPHALADAAGPPRADHSLSPTRTRPPCESTGSTTTTTWPSSRAGAIVEQRVGAVIVARRIEAPAADPHGRKARIANSASCGATPRPSSSAQKTGGDRRRADEDQEESRRDDLGDQEHHAADQPQPGGIDRRSFACCRARSARLRSRARSELPGRRRTLPWPARRSRRACRSTASPRPGTGWSWRWASARTRRSPRHISGR